MKNSILGFNQQYATTLKKEVEIVKNGATKKIIRKIDCTDLVILRWFVDFYPNMKMMEVDGTKYAWLSHKKLLDDLPIIDITKRSFIDRMQKLVDFKILTYKLVKEGGTFSLYGFGENYINLVQSTDYGMQSTNTGNAVKQMGGMQSTNYPVCSQPTNKDNFIKDNLNKDKTINIENKKFTPPTLEEIKNYCLERNNDIDAERFLDYYTSNGWMVGKNKMKDWRAAIRTWEKTQTKTNKSSKPKPEMQPVYDPSTFETNEGIRGLLGRGFNSADEITAATEFAKKYDKTQLIEFINNISQKGEHFSDLNSIFKAIDTEFDNWMSETLSSMNKS